MLAGSGRRSRHNGPANTYCNAHQLLQVRRFVEVKACLLKSRGQFSFFRESLPVGYDLLRPSPT